jgi:hypothetical protein
MLMAYLQLTMPGSDLDRHAHLLLTQWEHFKPSEGEHYGEKPGAVNIVHMSRRSLLDLALAPKPKSGERQSWDSTEGGPESQKLFFSGDRHSGFSGRLGSFLP